MDIVSSDVSGSHLFVHLFVLLLWSCELISGSLAVCCVKILLYMEKGLFAQVMVGELFIGWC